MPTPDRQKFTRTLLLGMAFVAMTSAGLASQAMAAEKKSSPLSLEDCGKCHAKVLQVIKTDGLAHRTKLTCIDCHLGHPPEERNIIPSCKKCHSGSAHFRLDGCSSCHYNAHSPRKLRLPRKTTGPCLTCHPAQGVDLEKFSSKHTTEGCTNCHETHGLIPVCVNCHRAHSPEMVLSDCRLCHKAHKPKLIRYDNALPSQHCATCHLQVNKTLTTSKTRHKDLRCVLCHKNEHRSIPACVECHPPHSAQSTVQGGCTMCHQFAHAPVPVRAVHFAANTPSATCGACHGAALNALLAGKSRHQRLECMFCHKGDHGSIPRCQDCHDTPHSQGMIEKFSGCGDCHGPAHALFK